MSAQGESQRPDTRRVTCVEISRAALEDPIGTAEHHDRYLLLELPMPWPHELWPSPRVPAGYRAIWQGAIARGVRVRPIAIAPDPAYSSHARVRLIHLRRPDMPFAEYERDEFVAPIEAIVPLTQALFDTGSPRNGSSSPSLAPFERYRAPADGVRDLLVCTHGSVDACCGTYGFPLYRELRDRLGADTGTRVWRASHFGGHRFAPTVVDLPVAQYWADLTPDDLELFERRGGPGPTLRHRYRGWGGLASAASQVVEREVLFRLGWASAAMPKTVQVSSDDNPDDLVNIHVDLATADGRIVAYDATVKSTGSVRVSLGCTEDHAVVSQYRVVRFEERHRNSHERARL